MLCDVQAACSNVLSPSLFGARNSRRHRFSQNSRVLSVVRSVDYSFTVAVSIVSKLTGSGNVYAKISQRKSDLSWSIIDGLPFN